MKRIGSLLLALTLIFTLSAAAFAAEPSRLDNAVNSAAAYVYGIVKNPEVGSVGGEWAVIGLARSGYEVPAAYYAAYYKTVEQYVKERQGVLHEKKYTEYSRLILGLTAAGYDPRNVAGYDLTLALGDFERTIWQGINGPVWALIALDSLNYSIPANPAAKTQATRDLYIKEILRRQLTDGGWNLTAGASGAIDAQERADADLTGMALQALAKYQEQPEVKAATDKALACLSQLQNPSGGYAYGSATASESTVQVLVALCELGITVDDPRFVKNGQTLVDNILSFRNADGSFNHSGSGGNNQMSTEQALYGLAAAKRAAENKNSLYRLSDAVKRGDFPSAAVGLPAKHADVQAVPVLSLGKTFDDVKNHPNQTAIEALAARGIITGVSETRFAPDAVMTRAEFAVLLTRGLGLSEKPAYTFADVPSAAWYAGYLGAASFYGITDSDVVAFNPNGAITRQEAAVMTARAAQLCGMETALDPVTIRDTLAQFGDYRTVAYRAQGPLAFCYRKGILDDAAFDIKPAAAGKRGEIAEMLYRLLAKAALL